MTWGAPHGGAEITPIEPDLVSTSEGIVMTTLDLTGPLQRLRAQVPLVQCITNTVVQQFSPIGLAVIYQISEGLQDHSSIDTSKENFG